ncbi:MAG: ATP synthase subunit b [Alphaproteobacteria bacterium MarineAlpha11_Bin1]|nr:MAG: ATP synthase subunit b [Alphaproteobacteria bacterium MarineAlpha11_Bin1]|tara:strand:- start:12626 stop:13108 length:483 start_codon:yes stop_codon:yes gene_type:complete
MLQDPTFWVAIGFLILLLLVLKYVRKPILDLLDSRVHEVRESLNEAATLREEAQQLLAEYQRKQRDAVKETEAMVERANDEAEQIVREGTGNLEETLKRRQELAMEKIAQAEADAIREVRAMSVEIAVNATRNLIAGKLDDPRADALVNDAIKDLSQKLH